MSETTQVIQSCLWILSEKIGSDIGLHRKPVSSLEKPVGSDVHFIGIFATGFRTGLRRKRSDRFLSNPITGYYRNRPDLPLGKHRIMSETCQSNPLRSTYRTPSDSRKGEILDFLDQHWCRSNLRIFSAFGGSSAYIIVCPYCPKNIPSPRFYSSNLH